MDELQSFTLCHDDWELIRTALLATAAGQLSKAHAIGVDSTYGAVLYEDGQKYKTVADYLELWLPKND